MSMLSLAPWTRTAGLFSLTATAGSFCLFCEKGVWGLPTEMSVDVSAAAGTANTNADRTLVANARPIRLMAPPFSRGRAGASDPQSSGTLSIAKSRPRRPQEAALASLQAMYGGSPEGLGVHLEPCIDAGLERVVLHVADEPERGLQAAARTAQRLSDTQTPVR